MPTQIFVNLPVKDLQRSVDFFTALGYGFNPQFTNADATCMIVSESICVMLLTEPFFQTFTDKPVADAHQTTEVLVCLSADSRGHIDDMVAKALAAGGTAPRPAIDHGFMYQHGYTDPDGHIWELVYMEPAAAGAPGA